MGTAIPANLEPFSWADQRGISRFFRPVGKVQIVGARAPLDIRSNPIAERRGRGEQPKAARFLVGFNVGGTPTWKLDDLIALVQQVREAQMGDPASSFIAQRGIYTKTAAGGKDVVREDGGQVVIVDYWGTPDKQWEDQMVQLAEEIVRAFQQDVVLLELQRGGVTEMTIKVVM